MPYFVDTNVALYAFQDSPKSKRGSALLTGATISVQVLNEFANVCIRKLGYDQPTLDTLIAAIRAKVDMIEPVCETTHDLARALAFRYRLSFYDSALLASARLADCDVFYSEDLQDGLIIEGQLTVRNPFA